MLFEVFDEYAEAFFTPGLKVVNAHPFLFALNAQDGNFYKRVKTQTKTLTDEGAGKWINKEPGSATFLREMLDEIHRRGYRFHTLGQLYQRCLAGPDSVRARSGVNR